MTTTCSPFVLARHVPAANGMGAEAEKLENDLVAIGFTIAGKYEYSDTAVIIIATNDHLKEVAAKSTLGAFGAVVRFSVCVVDAHIQVTYTNPMWTAGICRLSGSLEPVATTLKEALGHIQEFGTKKPLSCEALRKYNFAVGMPKFTNQNTLCEHESYEAACVAAETGLRAGKGHTRFVYRVDVPGKEETVFGAAVLEGAGADALVIDRCDTGAFKSVAHLPYELVVSGKKALSLDAKFRIAQSFPDTSMGNFMKISNCPSAITSALKAAAKNT